MPDIVLNGAETMAAAAELAGVKLAPIFPITPQTQVIDTLSKNGIVETLRGNSEYNVMSLASGAAWSGTRVFTATSSQGLIMMTELMWEVAGNRLPVVMGVFGRALKGPGWSLGTQQNDSLMMRDTGWLMFYVESAQEVLDFLIIAYRLAEEIGLPAMVVGDGFYLSHTNEIVSVPAAETVRGFLPEEPPRAGLPAVGEPVTFGPLNTELQYFEFYQRIHEEMEALPNGRLAELFDEFDTEFGRKYELIETVNVENAEVVVVSMSTIAGTVRALIQDEDGANADIGLVKLRSMRPFPGEQLAKALKGAKKVVVIDRNLSPCIGGIVAAEVTAELQRYGARPLPWIYSVVAGLGGLPVTRELVSGLLDDIRTSERPERVLFLK